MRGKQSYTKIRPFHSGITPAGAGKTLQSKSFFSSFRDHPRRCGENMNEIKDTLDEIGSPPQVRGKLTQMPRRGRMLRITPAGAGKTVTHHQLPPSTQDHPRRCGENVCSSVHNNVHFGSPPQVRGKPLRPRPDKHRPRITPAGAGKTEYYAFPDEETGDHPRRCGENPAAR